jgi:ribosomal protein S12 methylthiotransferase
MRKYKQRRQNHPQKRKLAEIYSVAFVSLGCPKNLIDSERMLGLLAADGFAISSAQSDADAIVINTCGFLEASKQEAVQIIREAVDVKEKANKKGRSVRVVVAGCLVQRQRSQLLDEVPGIDALVGVFDRENITAAVRGGEGESEPSKIHSDLGGYHPVTQFISSHDRSKAGYTEQDGARLRLTPRHLAYLRVSEGCNQGCTFCTIPSIRGRMRSKPLDAILSEARELILDGTFEINLIGQDTTSYGSDIGYRAGLSGLIKALDSMPGAGWIRLMYAYPSCFTDEMIHALAGAERFVKYIDMPLQHINDEILYSMRRKVTRRQIETLLGKLRKWIPDISIRTTLISGFPGETEKQHQELVQFVRDFGFDCLGVFEYSPEAQTPAGRLWKIAAVDAQTVHQRKEEIMLAQQEVVFRKNNAMTGRKLSVLIDSVDRKFQRARGRHSGQAPDIDGQVLLDHCNAVPGELIEARVEDWKHYDLIARPSGARSRAAATQPDLSLPMLQS